MKRNTRFIGLHDYQEHLKTKHGEDFTAEAAEEFAEEPERQKFFLGDLCANLCDLCG